MKTFLCSSVSIDLPWNHRPPNNNAQKSILFRTTTKKRLAELLRTSVYSLNRMGCQVREDWAHFAPKPETIYYNNVRCKDGTHIPGWIELVPDTCKHDFDVFGRSGDGESWNPHTAICSKCGVKYE